METVLIAVDGTKNSERIMSLLHAVVSSPKNIVLLHVEQLEGNSLMTAMLGDAEMSTLKESLKGTEHKEALDQKAEKILTFYQKKMEGAGLPNIKTIMREGHPSEEILKVADEEGVDLIVVGCSGKSRFKRYLTGCASREVERNAKVPVLITKGDGCGEHAEIWSGREAYGVR